MYATRGIENFNVHHDQTENFLFGMFDGRNFVVDGQALGSQIATWPREIALSIHFHHLFETSFIEMGLWELLVEFGKFAGGVNNPDQATFTAPKTHSGEQQIASIEKDLVVGVWADE